jgi:hypothetical protein
MLALRRCDDADGWQYDAAGQRWCEAARCDVETLPPIELQQKSSRGADAVVAASAAPKLPVLPR